MNKNNHHEPLIRISKKDAIPWQKAWLIRGLCILAAFVVCSLVIVFITDYNPLQVFASMFEGFWFRKKNLDSFTEHCHTPLYIFGSNPRFQNAILEPGC